MTETNSSSEPAAHAVLDHVALVVTDVEQASDFYCAVLGLDVQETVRLTDHTIRYLSSGTQVRMELIAFDDGQSPGPLSDGKEIAQRHMAWKVEDLEAALALVKQFGGSVHAGPTWVPELGFTSGLIRDPVGIESELLEYPSSS